VVAVDAVLLELFGKKYEGAKKHWDSKERRTIFGYKMHVIFSVTTGEPIAFYLHQEGDKDADVLDELTRQARQVLGVKKLGIILFDKGYWRLDEFKELVNEHRESMITPAKRYKDVKQAIADIKKHQWRRIGLNQRCAETTVHFGEHNITFRLMAWKQLGRRALKDEKGKRLKDAEGNVMTEPVVIIHSYLTNLSEVELEADQLLGMYGQRWGIEDFFEEMQNQYYLTKFPGTSLKIINRHIILTFLLYILVQRFQKLAADWLGRAEYALMELRRFGKEFLRAPIAYLLWLKAGKPKEQARRSSRRRGAFLGAFSSLGFSP
jgi:IS4 transposase